MSLRATLIRGGGGLLGWALILIGSLALAYSTAGLFMHMQGIPPGEPIFLDELAPTRAEAVRSILFSLAYLLLGIGIRHLSSKSKARNAGS
jgi:hypothetical protein